MTAPGTLATAVTETLRVHGPLGGVALRALLHVRRQHLLKVLASLVAERVIGKVVTIKIGIDSRPRRLTLYQAASEAPSGGSRAPDGGSREGSAADAEADLEFAEVPPDCPGCSLAGAGPGFCGRCARRREGQP